MAAIALLGVGALAAQAAWACVPQPLVYVEPLSSGPAGSQVTVTASAINGDVEVRWNTVEGAELAKASGPSFSVPITVPADAREGMYVILVLTRTAGGAVGSTGRAAFLVTAPDGSKPGGATTGGGTPAATPGGEKDQASRSSTGVRGAGLVFGVVGLLAVGLVLGALIARLAGRTADKSPKPGDSVPSSP